MTHEPKNPSEALLFPRLAVTKQELIAYVMNVDKSTASRIAHGQAGVRLDKLSELLDLLGLKLVDRNDVVLPVGEYMALKQQAEEAIRAQNILADLAGKTGEFIAVPVEEWRRLNEWASHGMKHADSRWSLQSIVRSALRARERAEGERAEGEGGE